tara:strand:+ start:5876 stop:6151 length:276 start_codon:yes stop_codon:yes gene_type:complete
VVKRQTIMASIQLTQVYLTQTAPPTSPPTMYMVEGSESFIAINTLALNAVGPMYHNDGSIMDVRQVYVTGSLSPIFVTDSYATVKGYIDAL